MSRFFYANHVANLVKRCLRCAAQSRGGREGGREREGGRREREREGGGGTEHDKSHADLNQYYARSNKQYSVFPCT